MEPTTTTTTAATASASFDAGDRVRELIDLAYQRLPYCRTCGRPTLIAERHGALEVVCPSLVEPASRFSRLMAAVFAGHEHERLGDMPILRTVGPHDPRSPIWPPLGDAAH